MQSRCPAAEYILDEFDAIHANVSILSVHAQLGESESKQNLWRFGDVCRADPPCAVFIKSKNVNMELNQSFEHYIIWELEVCNGKSQAIQYIFQYVSRNMICIVMYPRTFNTSWCCSGVVYNDTGITNEILRYIAESIFFPTLSWLAKAVVCWLSLSQTNHCYATVTNTAATGAMGRHWQNLQDFMPNLFFNCWRGHKCRWWQSGGHQARRIARFLYTVGLPDSWQPVPLYMDALRPETDAQFCNGVIHPCYLKMCPGGHWLMATLDIEKFQLFFYNLA